MLCVNCIFKGRLEDGSTVAVKVLSIELESLKGEREFISEIIALADIKHENLITLKGCCISGSNRFLIYDYMEKNSLALAFLGTLTTNSNISQMIYIFVGVYNILWDFSRKFKFLVELTP